MRCGGIWCGLRELLEYQVERDLRVDDTHRPGGDSLLTLRVPAREGGTHPPARLGFITKGTTQEMNARTRLAALLAAGSLVMALAAVTSAAPPTYGVTLTKSANPANVPSSGGTVVYTVSATATGTGFFGTVTVDDGMAGCTLGAPAGDTDTDGNLDPGETWAYSCTVNNVMPGAQNTATVNACHNGSGACNQSSHDATATSNTVTVGQGPDITQPPATQPPATQPPATQPPATQPPATQPPATQPPATQPPATQPPGTGAPTTDPNPTSEVDDDVDATMPSSDTAIGGDLAAPSSQSWLLVLALGMLLASIVIATPSRTTREERE